MTFAQKQDGAVPNPDEARASPARQINGATPPADAAATTPRKMNESKTPAPSENAGRAPARLNDGTAVSPDAAATTTPGPKEGAALLTSAIPAVISGWRRALLWPLGALMRLWGRTLRFEADDATLCTLQKRDEPVAFVLWHNRLFVTPEVFRRYRHGRPLYALVSASKDGAWLTAFFSLVGLRAVRGSSSRLGREAASALVDVLRAGNDVGITPDGPRGPCYTLKPGVLIVARRTQTPLLLLGAHFKSAWRLNRAWDRFYLPKPFSRVRLHCELVKPEALADREAAAAYLETRLREINPERSAPNGEATTHHQ